MNRSDAKMIAEELHKFIGNKQTGILKMKIKSK